MQLRGAVTRLIPHAPEAPRLLHPETGRPLRSAVVVDVDLDAGTVIEVPSAHPFEQTPDGVYALVWRHGRPLGEVVVAGPPDDVLADILEVARERLLLPLAWHALEDALGQPGALNLASARGLYAVPHLDAPVPGAGPTVTVAVCTRDRPEQLRRCLEALSLLREQPDELLVVDNGSDRRTREVVAAFPHARYVVEPRRGLDVARNRALHEAHHDVVAFTDDDAQAHPEWVAALRTTFADEPTALAVTGLVAPLELATSAQVLFEVLGGFGRGFRRKWFSAAIDRGQVAAAVFGGTGGAGTGANMAFRREPFLALGGFDPALDVGTLTGGGGDLEAFFRVVASGALLVYEPSAVVRHEHRQTMDELLTQMRGHGTGSYSYFLGAGRGYGSRQAYSFLRLALWWARTRHLGGLIDGLREPDVIPPAVRRAEFRGAVDAVVGRYYARSRVAAERGRIQAPLIRRAAEPKAPRSADPVIDVDLCDRPVVAADVVAPVGHRRVRVRVLRDGHPQHVATVATNGAAVSSVRLRVALVEALGPGLLFHGLGWRGASGHVLDGSGPSPLGLPEFPPLTGEQLDGVRALLTAGVEEPCTHRFAGTASVLLCTRDRPEQLRTALAALAGEALDVVVVDNSADAAVSRQAAAAHPRAVVVHEPRPGLSRARNAGLAACTGDVVVTIDDDVLVQPGWASALLAPFADPAVAAVTGAVLPARLDTIAAQSFEDYGGLHRGPTRRMFTSAWLRQGRGPAATWEIGATANAAFRRAALQQVGPFNERLGPGTPTGVGEDTEMFYRLLKAGHRIAYEPTAVVLHQHRETLDALSEQLRAYATGHVAYHLELALRQSDRRGLRRVIAGVPRHLLRQLRSSASGYDDIPMQLLWAQARGHAVGPVAWARGALAARRSGRT